MVFCTRTKYPQWGLSTMSLPTPFDYHRLLAEIFTSQLVSHGAILFASLTPLVAYVVGYLFRKDDAKPHSLVVKAMSSIIIGFLLGTTAYTFWRLYYYGQLLYVIESTEPLIGLTLPKYYVQIVNLTSSRMQQVGLYCLQPEWFIRPSNASLSLAGHVIGGIVISSFFIFKGEILDHVRNQHKADEKTGRAQAQTEEHHQPSRFRLKTLLRVFHKSFLVSLAVFVLVWLSKDFGDTLEVIRTSGISYSTYLFLAFIIIRTAGMITILWIISPDTINTFFRATGQSEE